nr:unnamed protein product [Callosobruchus chinensis]
MNREGLSTNLSALKQQIEANKEFLGSLNTVEFDRKDVLSWFKELCGYLTGIILKILEIRGILENEVCNKNTLLLYLQQISTTLSLYINTFVAESEIGEVLHEARAFIKKKLTSCLEGIEDVVMDGTSSYPENVGNFIEWMDTALEKISDIDYLEDKEKSLEAFSNAKILFEEVLSHAISIAQVLEALESLSNEISKNNPNPAMVNLFAETCSNKLCALERKVNVAVLKLCLNIFARYTDDLEYIHKFCVNTSNKSKSKELDNLVMEFDLHVDRMMQIGLFAISCSSNVATCIRIRSCLASLEALESELVPAFNAVLLDNCKQNSNLAVILKNHWLNEAAILKKLIFEIIDPPAFCQVVYEENKNLVHTLSSGVKAKKSKIDKSVVDNIIRNSSVLEDFLKEALIYKENNVDQLEENLSFFHKVIHEVTAASDIFIPQEKPELNFKVYKRCKILVNATNTVYKCLLDENNENSDLKVEPVSNEQAKAITGNNFLDHIINRGKQILQDRSILYRSNKTESFDIRTATLRKMNALKEKNAYIPLSKIVHLRKFSFIQSPLRSQTSCELQITERGAKSAERFKNDWRFPNCVGSMDGKHVFEKNFCSSYGYFGADYKFICVDIGGYGKNSDSGIFEASNMGRRFENGKMNMRNGKSLPGQNDTCPHVLIGDEGFALKPYLMRPFPYRQSRRDAQKETFNTRLCKARRVVENAVWYFSTKMENILQTNGIKTRCILHNFLRDNNMDKDYIELLEPPEPRMEAFENMIPNTRRATDTAFDIRQKFVNHFNN